jgi:pyruvate dehydrogenase E2 component (dihydrolipoamide acetyltransferase)
MQEVTLPDIGDFADVEIIEVLVAPGDRVAPEQSLLTLESDKATMDIPSPAAGRVTAVKVAVGQKLNRGDLILLLEQDEAGMAKGMAEGMAVSATDATTSGPLSQAGDLTATKAMTSTLAVETAPPPAARSIRAPGEAEFRLAPVLPRPEELAALAKGRKAHASPTVRRFARELGVDLTFVRGSGPKDRILKEDVQGYVKQALTQGAREPTATALPFALPPAPEVDFARFGPVEIRELSRIQKLSGRHLHRAWLTVPHVTQFDEADITELEVFRKARQPAALAEGVKLTLLPFLLKALARALELMPTFKASLTPDGEGLVMKHYTHIGVAVDTPKGLVVPVVRDVDRKGLYDLARELADLSQKAREGKLLPADMQGGCFSVSSLGGIGGTAFTPIVNAPEVAILGVSRAEMKPIWNGGDFSPRMMLPISLSYDHRVIDGADGARFTRLLGELLSDIRRLLL